MTLAAIASLAVFGLLFLGVLLWVSQGVPILKESADQLVWRRRLAQESADQLVWRRRLAQESADQLVWRRRLARGRARAEGGEVLALLRQRIGYLGIGF
jgi:hypothetical protein